MATKLMGECGKVGKKVINFRRPFGTETDSNREMKLKERDFFNQMLKTKKLLSVWGIELTSPEAELFETPSAIRISLCCKKA
jgi:hypothetical protein